jgi:L-lysine exporter family protein LysE/ArgO
MAEVIRHILLGLSVAIPPGPATVAIAEAGLRRGVSRAFLTAAGVAMADATYVLVVYFGLSGVVQIGWVRAVLLSIGAAVLLYLAYQSIRGAGPQVLREAAPSGQARSPLLAGYLVNIANPIAVLWWAAVFGSMVGGEAGEAAGPLVLLRGAAIIAGILSWHSTVALLTNWGRRLLSERTFRVLSLVAGCVLILFSLRFAYDASQVIFGEAGSR